jgi:hypothetical protein
MIKCAPSQRLLAAALLTILTFLSGAATGAPEMLAPLLLLLSVLLSA